MPLLGVFSFSHYTHGVPAGDLTGATHPNDPAAPTYDGATFSWIGEDFTYNGGGPAQISIADDDGQFQDGYVETGGAQTLDQEVTIGGTTYPVGSVVENEFALIDGAGQAIFVVRIDGQNVGFAYQTGETPTLGEVFTPASGLDGAPADNTDGSSSSDAPYAGIVCFAADTMIDTPTGPRLIEDLRIGDMVMTRNTGPQPIVWRNTQPIRLCDRAPTLPDDSQHPVRFSAGSLGPDTPDSPLIVSPQHRMFIQSSHAADMFGQSQVFVPAKALLALPGVRIMRGLKHITYHHIMLPRHAVVRAMGAQTETFYPGAEARKALSGPAHAALLAAVPWLRSHPTLFAYGQPAHPILSVAQGRRLARRLRARGARTAGYVPVAMSGALPPSARCIAR